MPASNRLGVTGANRYAVERLTYVLGESVDDIKDVLLRRFRLIRTGELGVEPRRIAGALLDQWARQSGFLPLGAAVAYVADLWSKSGDRGAIRRFLRTDAGFGREEADAAADRFIAAVTGGKRATEAADGVLWDLYAAQIVPFYSQTAHLILSRILLYRVGEDLGVFPEAVSGPTLERALADAASGMPGTALPALGALVATQRRLEGYLPIVYMQGVLDWWIVDEEHQRRLNDRQRTRLGQADAELDAALERVMQKLDEYAFGSVDVDVWRSVYQHYLPPEERQRLGGFYTPEELVDFTLDLAGYVPQLRGLCTLDILDFSSGSGTFPVQAAVRLLSHLDLKMDCHAQLQAPRLPAWQVARLKLGILQDRIHAVDVHVFASFLTTLNLLFQAMPLLQEGRRHYPDLGYNPDVYAHDALEKDPAGSRDARLWKDANSRVALSQESQGRFGALAHREFDLVMGNPPWGGVLKGRLSPLFDPELKAIYKKEYPEVATGKFNIYSLFLQRGVEWLKPGGVLAVITENRHHGQDFGSGVRRLLTQEAELRAIVDFEPYGGLFFEAMNSPCVTVATKGRTRRSPDCLVVRVGLPVGGVPGTSRRERIQWVIAEARRALQGLASRRPGP